MPRTVSQDKSWKAKIIFFLACFAVAVGLFVGLVALNDYLKIQQIKVISPATRLSVAGLENVKGQNLLLLSKPQLEQLIRDRNSYIKDVTLSKEYPHTVVIHIDTYGVAAQLLSAQGYFILSADGRILKKTKEKVSGLPLITYYQRLSSSFFAIGDTISYSDILKSLIFLNDTKNLGLDTDAIDITQANMIAFSLKDQKIYFSQNKDYQTQKYQLTEIYKKLKIEGKSFKSLDLRFEKPVIKF